MDDSKYTKTETAYKHFDKAGKIVMYSVLLLTVVFIVLFFYAKSDGFNLLFGLLSALNTVAMLVIAPIAAKKRTAYLKALRDERDSVIRTGLFKEIYDAYWHDEFEHSLTCDRFLSSEYYNNTIDICIRKNNHEFLIEMDEKAVSVICDEETDHPVEMQLPLSEVSALEQLYSAMNDFINEYSR